MTNGAHVSWDRFDATVEAINRRLGDLEQRTGHLGGAEQEHLAMGARITALELAAKDETAAERGRRDRAWVLGLALVSGLVLPLLTTAVIAFLHLRSTH